MSNEDLEIKKPSRREPDRVHVRVRGPDPQDPDTGPTVVTDARRGVAVGFDGDGLLRTVVDTTDLDLFEREQLVDQLHDIIAKVLDGRLGRALH